MSIENLKKILESERDIGAEKYISSIDMPESYQVIAGNHFKSGSKDMENRLIPLLQKAVEMAEFVINHSQENTYNNIKAREFLLSLSETAESVFEFTKMTEIKKDGVE